MNLGPSKILVLVLLAVFAIALLQSKDELHAEATWCTFVCDPVPTATPTASPSPTPSPTPPSGPSPTPTPLPATIVVNAAGGDDFTTIQAAVNTADPGDVIKVKNGTYASFNTGSRHGTEVSPIYLEPYPGHSPVIEQGFTSDQQIQLNAEWWIVRGFEINGGYFGLRILDDNMIVADNVFHNNGFDALLVVPADEEVSNILITGNSFYVVGYEESGTCDETTASSCTVRNIIGDTSAKNRHATYLSNSLCNGISNVTIEWNHYENLGGRAIQLNGLTGGDGAPCSSTGINNIIVRNNMIVNASWGMSLFYGWADITVDSNTFNIATWPTTNDSDHTFIGVWGANGLDVLNNSFASSSSSVRPYMFFDDEVSCPTDDLDHNTFDLNTNSWMWNNSVRSDFSSAFTSVTGCGANDILN